MIWASWVLNARTPGEAGLVVNGGVRELFGFPNHSGCQQSADRCFGVSFFNAHDRAAELNGGPMLALPFNDFIYFDTACIARLYFEDAGWERVRSLAARAPIGCGSHGYAELVSVIYRKLREGVLSSVQYRQVLQQFVLDCDHHAYLWFPVSTAVNARVLSVYRALPRKLFLRAADALHLACAAESGFLEIYSNDQKLLAAAFHFGLRGIDIISGPR